jgi:putative transposase
MRAFSLSRDLVINYREDIWRYERVIKKDERDWRHQFVSEITGEVINFAKREFFDLVDQRKIIIVPATVNTKELLAEIDEEKKLRCLSGYSEKQLQDLDRKFEYIAACKKLGISSGQHDKIAAVIAEVAPAIEPEYADKSSNGKERRPPSRWAVSEWLNEELRAAGDVHEVIDKYHLRGRKGFTGPVLELMDQAIDKIYMNTDRNTVPDTHTHLRNLINAENAKLKAEWVVRKSAGSTNGTDYPLEELVLPSISTLERRIKQIPEFERLEARYGRDYAIRVHRSTQHENFAKRPNEFVEFDFAWTNTFLLDDEMLLPMGRPVVAVCRCKGTGLVTGYYLSFARPSTFVALSTIYESILPKDRILDRYAGLIESPWPAEGVMQHLISDNERCNHGVVFRRMMRELYSHLIYTKVRSPWLKGGIEGYIGQQQREFENRLPGGIKGLLDRSDYDPEKDTILRFSTFVFLVFKWIIDVYNQTPQRRRKCSPYQGWMEKIEYAPPRYAACPIELALICAQDDKGTLQVEGITKDYIRYNSPQLVSLREKHGPGFEVRFRFLDNDLSRIFVQIPGTHEFIEVETYDRSYVHRGMTRWQHCILKKVAKIKYWTPDVIERLARAKEQIRLVVAEELERNTSATVKKLAQQTVISSSMVLAGRPATVAGAFGTESAPSVASPSGPIILPDTPAEFMVPSDKIVLLDADVALY